jgi:hypothetical protein
MPNKCEWKRGNQFDTGIAGEIKYLIQDESEQWSTSGGTLALVPTRLDCWTIEAHLNPCRWGT